MQQVQKQYMLPITNGISRSQVQVEITKPPVNKDESGEGILSFNF